MSSHDTTNQIPGYGPENPVKRLVRTRMLGVVGAGREKLPATRLVRDFEYKLD